MVKMDKKMKALLIKMLLETSIIHELYTGSIEINICRGNIKDIKRVEKLIGEID